MTAYDRVSMRWVPGTVVTVLSLTTALTGTAAADLRKGPYLQDVTPASATVMWEADPPAAATVTVEGPGLPPGGTTVDVAAGASTIARADLPGLAPATRYHYTLAIGEARETGEFATAPAAGTAAPTTFVVFGDNGPRLDLHQRLIDLVVGEAPDFVISTGDLVKDGGNRDLWQRLFAVEAPLARDRVIYPALGNHDVKSDERPVDPSGWFALPGDGAGLYYAFGFGRSRVIVLDSNLRGAALDAETAWLTGELAAAHTDARIDHVFVVMHHPLFSIGFHGGKLALRRIWAPLFARYAVSAVFAGHDHDYERGAAGGVHYFVSGGAGASLYPTRDHDHGADAAAIDAFEAAHHYLRVAIDAARVEVTAIRVDGSTIETTRWTDRGAHGRLAVAGALAAGAAAGA